jgi:hypothetical protein
VGAVQALDPPSGLQLLSALWLPGDGVLRLTFDAEWTWTAEPNWSDITMLVDGWLYFAIGGGGFLTQMDVTMAQSDPNGPGAICSYQPALPWISGPTGPLAPFLNFPVLTG